MSKDYPKVTKSDIFLLAIHRVLKHPICGLPCLFHGSIFEIEIHVSTCNFTVNYVSTVKLQVLGLIVKKYMLAFPDCT